uniref:Integrase n=1 Tax=Arthrobacter sp. 68b TaxID=311808 RepID=A0A0F7G2H3_9MICC|nr:hypothetical protein [Arthrobacter sp. 68b]
MVPFRGFLPRMLVDADIGLFRADERVFTAMLDGWRAQMPARGLTTQTIKQRCQLLERFQRFTGAFPWQWRRADIDDFLATRLCRLSRFVGIPSVVAFQIS